ncbi:MAG: hypothetical protein U7M05_08670 [Candidatus Igneacidithiobacillus chanchocoensis]
MSWQFPKMTRRNFLKTTGLSAVGATLYRPNWIKLAGPTRPDSEDHFAHSICNYCSSFCSLRVTVGQRKGQERIMKLGGNPNSTLNGDKICARGQSGLRQIYSANRIKTPLIRVAGSKRGEMKFRAATWEEAWAYIAQKSKGIRPWEWTIATRLESKARASSPRQGTRCTASAETTARAGSVGACSAAWWPSSHTGKPCVVCAPSRA